LGYIKLHQERYLIECISTESDVDYETVKKLLKNETNSDPHSLHLAKKVQNLHNAVKDIFPSIFFPNLPMDRFTPSFARRLHQQVGGNGLIDNAGQYRTKFSGPAQDDFCYMDPVLIENELEKLFRQCRENFEKEDLQLEEAIKFGACFFAHFLYIHPFSNGNGRVARLLLSFLLSNFTVVPLSLYTGAKTRENYLQCLREAQWYNDPPFKPSVLATFILENVHLTSHNICVIMDIKYSEQ
jgi:fido (protein-threonine AMPylation protein)